MYEASKDYGTGEILILFDGPDPTEDEIRDYVSRNYGCECFEIEVESESGFYEYHNPGTIKVKTK